MNDNVSVLGGNKTENKLEEKKVENKPLVSVKEGVGHFLIGAGLALVSFVIAYILTMFLFSDQHYICKTLSTIFISYLFINAYDYATAKQPTLKAGPVKNFTILFSFIILVNGYNDYGKPDFSNLLGDNNKKELVQSSEEKLFLYKEKSFVVTAKKFNPDDCVKVIVRQNTVRLNNNFLEPGEYTVPITGIGPLVFDCVAGAPANIEVYY